MAIQRDKITANAEKLVTKGKIQEAIKEYDRLLDDNPNDVNTLNRVGDLWVRINRTDEAVKSYSRIADHYAKDGFFLKAIAIYKKINKLDPSKLDVYGKLADLYAKQGLAMEAKSQYQVLADYYSKHGDPAGALNIFKKIAELDPNSINIHVKLADLYVQANQTGEALKEYDRVGRMLLKRGMLEEAIQVFRKALKIDPSNVELVESLVTTLLESRDFDNATKLIETSLEANRGNPRLTALLGKTFLAKGEIPRARKVLEQGLALNPGDTAIRESLADMYLRQNAPDEALNVMMPVIDSAPGRSGVEMLNRVLRIDQSHIPTLEKLVAVYNKLKEETNILAAMNSLAEAHISRGDQKAAARVLQELIKREPENAQHRKKLAFVEQGRGGKPAAAPPPPPPPPKVEEEVEELPVAEEISFDQDSFGGEELSIDLDASEPTDVDSSISLDLGVGTADAEASPDLASMEGESEDLDFITEHMTEAEVFAKYGLAEKAIEHLQAIIERSPRHVGAFERLLKIFVDEGNTQGVRSTATPYLALLRDIGENDVADTTESELRASGYFEGEGGEAGVAEEAEALTISDFQESEETVSPAAEEELALESVSEAQPDIEVDLSAVSFDTGPVTAADAEPLPEETAGGDIVFDSPTQYVPTEPVPEEVSAEDLAEIDSLLRKDKIDEARKRVDLLLQNFPDDREVLSRDLKVEAAAKKAKMAAEAARKPAPPPPPPPKPAAPPPPPPKPAAKPAPPPPPPPAARPAPPPPPPAKAAPPPPPKAAPPPPPPPPPVISAEEIESELLSGFGDEEEVATAKGGARGKPSADDENLFADEDNFFDLAAELEEELEADAQETLQIAEEEQSLEEIFKEFKKGVEQQLDSEDYETHYNLGIAYKEMGLVDEAIGEFQLASKDPKRLVECCSMLGLCFLEKGMPQLSVKWYLKGLEASSLSEEMKLGLRYDLGSAYAEMGDVENAQKTFQEIYGVNSNYRDVAARLKELQKVGR